jgi:hypothetical protein
LQLSASFAAETKNKEQFMIGFGVNAIFSLTENYSVINVYCASVLWAVSVVQRRSAV